MKKSNILLNVFGIILTKYSNGWETKDFLLIKNKCPKFYAEIDRLLKEGDKKNDNSPF